MAAHNPDKLLIKRVLRGDKEAYRDLIRKYERLVKNIVFRMVKGREDREDLCQEVFVKVYRKLPGFRFEAKLSTWIVRIAYTSCLNHLQKKKTGLLGDLRKTEENEEEGSVESWENYSRFSVASGSRPDQQLLVKETYTHLQTEIDTLPEVFRALVTLYHLQELSYQEICEVTGLPINTVKSYLHRARKQLKNQLLKKYHPQEIWK